MQFTKFVIALGFISASLSSPVAIESRQQTLPQAIDSITKTLTTGVNANLLTLRESFQLHHSTTLLLT